MAGHIWRAKIEEKGILDRLEKLKNLDESKIKAIGSYEKKLHFWSTFRQKNEFLYPQD